MSNLASFFKRRDANKTPEMREAEEKLHQAAMDAVFGSTSQVEVVNETAPEVDAPAVETPEVVATTEVVKVPRKRSKLQNQWARDMVGQTVNGFKILAYNEPVTLEKNASGVYAHVDAVCPYCGKTFTHRAWNIKNEKASASVHCGCQRKKKEVEVPVAEMQAPLAVPHVEIAVEVENAAF